MRNLLALLLLCLFAMVAIYGQASRTAAGDACPPKVTVERIPPAPAARPLGELAPGAVFELAIGDVCVVPNLQPTREPYTYAPDGLPIGRPRSAPIGWPEPPPAPAGWVYVIDLGQWELWLLPATWQTWPAIDARLHVRVSP